MNKIARLTFALLITVIQTSYSLSIKDYLIKNPEIIKSRSQENSLDLSELELTNLEGLEYLPKISEFYYLNLKNNNLEVIPNDAFYSMPKLERLDLCANNITTIEPFAFRNLSSLTWLNISYNDITSVGIWLAGLFQLRTLDLSFNGISSFKPNVFRDLKHLHNLYLNNNQLIDIAAKDFRQLQALKKLDLSENPLTNFTEKKEQHLEDVLPSSTIIIL